LLLGLLFSNPAFADAGGKQANEIGSMGPVPKAQCGPSDRTESGLQGQTTSEERASGDSELGYNCNLELDENAEVNGLDPARPPSAFRLLGTQLHRDGDVANVLDLVHRPRVSKRPTSGIVFDKFSHD